MAGLERLERVFGVVRCPFGCRACVGLCAQGSHKQDERPAEDRDGAEQHGRSQGIHREGDSGHACCMRWTDSALAMSAGDARSTPLQPYY
jgi:hypothetical protein